MRKERFGAIVAPLLLALLLLLSLDRAGLDARITDLFFDAGTWPWIHDFWTERVLHRGGRLFMIGVAVGVLGVAVSAGRVTWIGARWRWPAVYFLLAYAGATGLVSILKANSAVPCPWYAVDYGGDVVHDASFRFVLGGVPHGRCSPGGHASGGFAWMASYWALRNESLGTAWTGMGLGLAFGFLFSAAQVARGAHFASHNAWSLAWTWSLCLVVYFACPAGRLWRAREAAAAA